MKEYFIIGAAGIPVILDDRNINGAHGGVILPMPRFTPSIAAKCIGLTPISGRPAPV